MELKKAVKAYETVKKELEKVIVGQEDVIEDLLISIFSGGHVLLEGVPGLGKTLLARSLSYIIGGSFKRIQFTPDLMPSDIIGTTVYNADGLQPEEGRIHGKKGACIYKYSSCR